MKKFISALICATIVVSSSSNVFASTNLKNIPNTLNQSYETVTVNDQVSIYMTKEEIDSQLKNLGFTNQEIKELHSRNLNSRDLNLMGTMAFPSNPKDGDIYNSSFKITNADLGLPGSVAGCIVPALSLSKATIAKKIVAKYGISSLAWSAMAAGLIIGYINDKQGFTGFNINVSWRYGLTNDLVMGWSVGPTSIVRLR